MKGIHHVGSRRKWLLTGAILLCALIFLTAAVGVPGGVGGIGRYQLDAWAFSTGNNTGQYGAFVLDTTTGETRLVFQAEYTGGKLRELKNRLGKTFYYYDSDGPEAGQSIMELKKRSRMPR